MLDRTKARRRALEVLYEADVLDDDWLIVLERAGEVDDYARMLVHGVVANRDEIDSIIRRLADRWELERMPVVDRNLLRIGVFEILHRPDVPVGATINDAVDLAKLLSTPDSGRFVNGLLGRVARDLRESGEPGEG